MTEYSQPQLNQRSLNDLTTEITVRQDEVQLSLDQATAKDSPCLPDSLKSTRLLGSTSVASGGLPESLVFLGDSQPYRTNKGGSLHDQTALGRCCQLHKFKDHERHP